MSNDLFIANYELIKAHPTHSEFCDRCCGQLEFIRHDDSEIATCKHYKITLKEVDPKNSFTTWHRCAECLKEAKGEIVEVQAEEKGSVPIVVGCSRQTSNACERCLMREWCFAPEKDKP